VEELSGSSFAILFGDRGLRACGWFARRHHLDGCERSSFDSSDDKPVGRVYR
jgi:hypothetical protein